MNTNFINWKSYYKDNQIEEYNLRNTYCINLFNTNNLDMSGDNQINYLNPYLGELPMMYYIWKNNLKSDYICISQYRRDLTYIDFNKLNKNEIQLIYLWEENNNIKLKDRLLSKRDPSGKIKKILWKFLTKHYNLSKKDLQLIQNKTSYSCMACFVWAMNWNTYCKLCELIFGFLDALFPNNEWQNINTILKFRDNEKNIYKEKYGDDGEWIYNDKRYLTFIIEDTLSVILGQFFNLFTDDKQIYIYSEINKNDINDCIIDIARFYKLNLKCNPNEVVIKCLDNNLYNKCYKFFIEDYNWEFNKIKIINSNDKYDISEYVMKLNINEYIDINEPINIFENKYNIKKI